MKYSSVRIIFVQDENYLLAQHNNKLAENIGKWGLPGGHIEEGEKFVDTINREMLEEFSIELGVLSEIADFEYKGSLHKVFATKYEGDEDLSFDRNEILNIRWLSYYELLEYETKNLLHTGFEVAAVKAYLQHSD